MKYRTIPVTHFDQNCSLVWCSRTRKAALIDPGGEEAKLIRMAGKEGLSIEKILLTHGHIDHVGAAKNISQKLDIPVIGPHLGDAYWLEMLPVEAKTFGFPKQQKLTPHMWLSDGQVIDIGEISLSVIHTPGHTPGHVVFYHPETKTAFVGDVIFKDSVGRTDFPGGNEKELIDSIYNKLLPLGDDVTFIPGHGENSTFGRERKMNPYLVESTSIY